jgi:hypothetical protein
MTWLSFLLPIKEWFKWILQNPRVLRIVAEVIALIWIVVCCLTHCGSGNGGNGGSSDTVFVTKTELIFDNEWHTLMADSITGLIASYELRLKRPVWKAPEADFTDSKDCSDSLSLVISTLDYCDEQLTQCDERYRDDYAIRNYTDTISDDSLNLFYNIQVQGRLLEAPRFNYNIRVPQKVITNTITITNTLPPRRKVYLGAGLGARLPWESDRLSAIVGSTRLGYTDRKNQSYGLRGDFSRSNYSISFEYAKSFHFGK